MVFVVLARCTAIYRDARRQLPTNLKHIVRVLDDEFVYLENYLDNNLPKESFTAIFSRTTSNLKGAGLLV